MMYMQGGIMSPRVLFVSALTFATLLANSAWGCYDTQTVNITCDGANNCHQTFQIDQCKTGGSGSYCNTGYGTCCGSPYSSSNASGTCFSPTGSNHSLVISTTRQDSRDPRVAQRQQPRDSTLVSAQLFLIPDRCRRSYRIIDADDLQKVAGGN